MSPQQREDDRLIGQLIQRLDDYTEQANLWREKHDADSKEFRESINRRLAPMEEWLQTANSSWKLVIGTITVTGMIFKAWDYVRAHWH